MRRPIIIIVVCFVLSAVGFLFLAQHVEHQLVDRPYIAGVKTALRALADAQAAYRATNPSHATDVAQLPANRDSTRGVRVRIVAASADGFLADGRHEFWTGRCAVAVGPFAGDTLTPGEPRCYGP